MTEVIDSKNVKWAEYVDESTLGTTPTNPTMVAFPGDLVEFVTGGGADFEEYPVLKGATDTDPLSAGDATKTSETHSMKVTLKPQDMSLIPYALLGTTTTTYAPGKVPHYQSIGMRVDDQYSVFKGGILSNFEFDIPDMKNAATLTLDYMGVERSDWSGTSYIGTGSHGTAPTSAPFTMGSLSSILYDGAAPSTANILIDSIKFSIKNNIEPVEDAASALASKIAGWSFGQREIGLELGVTMMDVGVQDDIFDGSAHTFAFTLDAKTYTFSNIFWVNAPDTNMSPADRVGMSLQSSGVATRLAIA